MILNPIGQSLKGELSVPGDKSISHRAVMFGSIAAGTTEISGFLSGADCLSTIDCFRRMGIVIETGREVGQVIVKGKGLHGLKPFASTVDLDTGNSGTTTRILCGILAPQRFNSILSGDESVNKRPMGRVIDPLRSMGAEITSVNGGNTAPLRIEGRPLHGRVCRTQVASAQVKSAILCAGLYADSPTTVIEPSLSRDHTERMLSSFGAKTMTLRLPDGVHEGIFPADELYGQKISVPGDISSAAYFIAAALLVKGSEIRLKHVGLNPTRAGILEILKAMGGNITIENEITESGEPCGDIIVRSSDLHGVEIGGEIIPAAIDELPVVAVAAAFAGGVTIIRDASELRVKESDRIEAMTEGLKAMGADVSPTPDGMIIQGGKSLHGSKISCRSDHRIAMSFAVASLLAEGETELDNTECVKISYPGFFDDLASLIRT